MTSRVYAEAAVHSWFEKSREIGKKMLVKNFYLVRLKAANLQILYKKSSIGIFCGIFYYFLEGLLEIIPLNNCFCVLQVIMFAFQFI